MSKTYTFTAEAKSSYLIYVEKFKITPAGVMFDAKLVPPKGHQLALKNVYMNFDKTIKLNRGSGFELKPSTRLMRKLIHIGSDLLKQDQQMKRVQFSRPKQEDPIPKLFDRTNIENSKLLINQGNTNE